jgi:hypothetical protein
MNNLFKSLMPLQALCIVVVTGCYKADGVYRLDPGTLPLTSTPINVDLVPSADHIEDKDRMWPTNDAALLWNNRGHTPILDPAGHQVTLGEFKKVTGIAKISCVSRGTRIDINLQGLIPKGRYSTWIFTFKLPGFHNNFSNLIGNGALNLNNGTENRFTASLDGSASLSTTIHAQSLALFGSIGDCLFSEFEIHLMVAYSYNNGLHNGPPDNPDSWVTQFYFPFRGN